MWVPSVSRSSAGCVKAVKCVADECTVVEIGEKELGHEIKYEASCFDRGLCCKEGVKGDRKV